MVTERVTYRYTVLRILTALARQVRCSKYSPAWRWRFPMFKSLFGRFAWMTIAMTMAFPSMVLVSVAQAQSQNGEVHGTVTDPTGALVPAATVVLSNAAGFSKSVTSGQNGTFAFSGVAPGSYSLAVSAAGFAPASVENIKVVAGKWDVETVALQLPVDEQQVQVKDESLGVDHEPRQQRQCDGDQRQGPRCTVRRSGRVAERTERPGRSLGRTQWRADLHRWVYRRPASAEVVDSRDSHQSESVLGAVRQAGLRPH